MNGGGGTSGSSNTRSRSIDHILQKYPELLEELKRREPPPKHSHLGVYRIARRRTMGRSRASHVRRLRGRLLRQLHEFLFLCPECKSILNAPITLDCGHTFCKGCLNGSASSCPTCSAEIDNNRRNTNILVQDILCKWKATRELPCNDEGSDFKNQITSSDFECVLCSQCLLDPITTTCGHTFCRSCLARVLDHGLACPLCMSTLRTTDLNRKTTEVLVEALQMLVPEEHNKRLLASQNEISILGKNSQVPVFVCTNAFPGVACPLFVYEPRYRLLTRRCLQSAVKRFAMAVSSGGRSSTERDEGEKFASYGTLLEVRDAVLMPDGTSILTTVGLRRFKVIARGEKDGYDTAEIQYIKDANVSREKLTGLVALHRSVRAKAVNWVQSLNPIVFKEIERSLGPMPCVEKDWISLPDGPAWAWWLMPILPLNSHLQLGFLSSTSLEKRLRAIDKLLDHLNNRIKMVEMNSVNCVTNDDSSRGCSFSERTIDVV